MFDSDKELLEQVSLGKDTYLDLKEVRINQSDVTRPSETQLADILAAFANTQGGVCVLGVSDRSREVVGLPLDCLKSVVGFVRNVCTQLIQPEVNPIVRLLWLPNTVGDQVAVVKVEIKKSLFVHRSPSGYLLRSADKVRVMSSSYLARLLQQRSQMGMIGFDQQTVSDADLEALSQELWRRFTTSSSQNEREKQLSKLCMARNDEDGTLRPTVAGILMATQDPRRWLPNAFVQAVAYRGTQIRPRGMGEYYQLDAANISGPLDVQVERACRFVGRNMKIAAYKDLGRTDCPQFDMAAVFEALVNAVAHRDYSIYGSKIRLRMFADRLELYSPGEIPATWQPEDLLYLQASRNKIVSSLLAKCPVPVNIPGLATTRNMLMGRCGNGMQIIVDNSLKASGKRPKSEMIGRAELHVTIYGAVEGGGRLGLSL